MCDALGYDFFSFRLFFTIESREKLTFDVKQNSYSDIDYIRTDFFLRFIFQQKEENKNFRLLETWYSRKSPR